MKHFSTKKRFTEKLQEVIILGSYKGREPKAYAIAPNEARALAKIAWELKPNYPERVWTWSIMTVYSNPNAKCELTGL